MVVTYTDETYDSSGLISSVVYDTGAQTVTTTPPVGTFAAPGDPSAPPANTAAAAEATIAANTLRFTPYLP